MTTPTEALKLALEALQYMHSEKCDYMRRNNLGDPLREDASRLALPAMEAARAALAQAGQPTLNHTPEWFGMEPPNHQQPDAGTYLFTPGKGFEKLPDHFPDAGKMVQAEQPAEQAQPVAWVNPANLASASVSRERGGPFDQHTWSEQRTDYHTAPLYAAPTAAPSAQPVAVPPNAQPIETIRYLLNAYTDHATGRPRGLLCPSCNSAIGLLGEDPKRFAAAVAYLEKHRG